MNWNHSIEIQVTVVRVVCVVTTHLNRDLGDRAPSRSPSAALSGCIMLQTVLERAARLTVFLPRSCIGSPYRAGTNGDCRGGAGGALSADGDHEGWY